jgi:hypothetical protein
MLLLLCCGRLGLQQQQMLLASRIDLATCPAGILVAVALTE